MKKYFLPSVLLAAMNLPLFAQTPKLAKPFSFDQVDFIGALGEGAANDWTKGWTNWNPNATVYPGDANYSGPVTGAEIVAGDITVNTTWTNDKVWKLEKLIHVKNGATLTIQEGTVIRGLNNGATIGGLVISKGAKIYAVGTAEKPIVFTSEKPALTRAPGNWAGLIISGNGVVNTPLNNPAKNGRSYEALPVDRDVDFSSPNPDPNDSSGVMEFVRVEFAGYAFATNQEINGITFAALGKRTHINYVQVSFSADDDFEWFGGSSDHKYLVGFAGSDDIFDMDEGYNGKSQFLLGVRHPLVYETVATGQSNGLEHDNNTNLGTTGTNVPDVNNPTPETKPIISNLTVAGPLRSGATKTTAGALNADGATRFNNAFELRTGTSTNIFNSVAFGFPSTLVLNNRGANITPTTATKASQDSLTVRNLAIANADRNAVLKANQIPTGFTFGVRAWFLNGPVSGWAAGQATGNVLAVASDTFGLTNPTYRLVGVANAADGTVNNVLFDQADFTLKADAPAFMKQARFDHPRLAGSVITGLAEETLAETQLVVVYPNPATQSVEVALNKNFANATVRIVNTLGEVVASKVASELAAELNVSALQNGLYIVNVVAGGKSVNKTLLIQR